MNWTELRHQIESINSRINEVPHKFKDDIAGDKPLEVLQWIRENNQDSFPDGLIPIYGYVRVESYDGNASILLVNPVEGKFYEIHGGHCSCYGFEGQFNPEECPLEYLEKGKKWADAYQTVLEVVKYFEQNPYN